MLVIVVLAAALFAIGNGSKRTLLIASRRWAPTFGTLSADLPPLAPQNAMVTGFLPEAMPLIISVPGVAMAICSSSTAAQNPREIERYIC